MNFRGKIATIQSDMDKGSLAPPQTLTALGGSMTKKMQGKKSKANDPELARLSKSATSQFLNMALNMSWQLAAVVLVPIFVGVKLDKAFGTNETLTFVGLGLAVVGSIAVMWHALQAANKLPVPKLTDAQKRKIKKSYEDEDKDE